MGYGGRTTCCCDKLYIFCPNDEFIVFFQRQLLNDKIPKIYFTGYPNSLAENEALNFPVVTSFLKGGEVVAQVLTGFDQFDLLSAFAGCQGQQVKNDYFVNKLSLHIWNVDLRD